jgi:hypothetical protein
VWFRHGFPIDAGAGFCGLDAGVADAAASDAATCDYAAPEMCATAVELSSIAGDQGADTRTVNGTTSRFFKVLVAESFNMSAPLSYTATLVSPPGMVFDLYVYPGDASAPDYTAAPATIPSGEASRCATCRGRRAARRRSGR